LGLALLRRGIPEKNWPRIPISHSRRDVLANLQTHECPYTGEKSSDSTMKIWAHRNCQKTRLSRKVEITLTSVDDAITIEIIHLEVE
jgi:hypothetical protein